MIIPAKILEQHGVVLGKTGAGKSSALRYIVEHLLDKGKRVCIVDPKGDWWGLKSSADGKSAGYPIITFGDFKNEEATDVPINAQSGKHIAELITAGNRPAIIGFRGWMTSHMVQFWIDFASGIFNANSGELYLVVDEVHNFAPKGKIMDPQAGKCLHWSNRLMSEGRGLGIVALIASQRPQKVHNDTLTSCETLIAMRVVHAADRSAVEEWIKGCGDKEQGTKVLNNLANLPRGDAFVWSPESGYGPSRVTFPMFKTFDSFAPPQLQKKVHQRTWADVDLGEVEQKLAKVIEEAKRNDPKLLQQEIHKLRTELAKKPDATPPAPEVKIKEIPILKAGEFERIEKLEGRLVTLAREFWSKLEELQKTLNSAGAAALHPNNKGVKMAPVKSSTSPSNGIDPDAWRPPIHDTMYSDRRPVKPLNSKAPTSVNTRNGSAPTGGMRRMMIALAQRPGMSAKQIGIRAGLSSKSGTFGTYLSILRSNGWIEGDKHSMRLTDTGLESLGGFDALPEGEELFRYWRGQLGDSGAGRMLQALFQAYPNALTKEELGDAANISSRSGTFGTYLSTLRSLELASGSKELKASDEFFQ